MEELFNLRHAQLRNAIERIFGIVKRKFRIIASAPEYSIPTQSKIILAVCALWNFIRCHDPDNAEAYEEEEIVRVDPPRPALHFQRGASISRAEGMDASKFRDEIAKAMWNDYLLYTCQRPSR
jgi:hypothetical protein